MRLTGQNAIVVLSLAPQLQSWLVLRMFDERLTPPDDPAHENPEDDGMTHDTRHGLTQQQNVYAHAAMPESPTGFRFIGSAGELAAWCNVASDNALVDALGIIKHMMDIRLASAAERTQTLKPVFNQLANILALPPENADDIAF